MKWWIIGFVVAAVALFIAAPWFVTAGYVLVMLLVLAFTQRWRIKVAAASAGIRNRDFVTAEQHLISAAGMAGTPVIIGVQAAYYALRNGHTEVARNLLTKAGGKRMDTATANSYQLNMALVDWKEGRLEDGIHRVRRVLKEGGHTVAYGTLGFFLLEAGETEEALRISEEAVLHAPEDAVILDNLSLCLLKTGAYPRALEVCEKLLTQEPKFIEAYANHARVLLALGDRDGAAQAMEKAAGMKINALSTITQAEIDEILNELK